MQNQRLEDTINTLKNDQGTHPSATLKRLRTVLKAFGSYSTTADTLPPPTLIPVCLFALPTLFKKLLGFQDDQVLQEPPQRAGLRLCIQLYLRGLLRLLGECEQQIKHVVVQSMSKSILLTVAFPDLSRKWVRALISVWATSGENLNLSLRCFMALGALLRKSSEQFYMWALRRVYVGFFQHCGQVSWRTLEHLNFMVNCFCELAQFNQTRSYYVLFGYLRSIAVQLSTLNTLKGKNKMELVVKLYSQQTLQILRLYGQLVGLVGDGELSALAYPLAQIINAYEHISESPEYLPLKLHLIQIQLQMMEQTGLYIPHTLQTLLKIFKAAPLQKKHSRKAGVQGSIQLGYKLSQLQLKNTNIVNDIFQKSVYFLYWLHSITSKSLAAPEIAKCVSKQVTSIQFGFMGYRKQLKEAAKLFRLDADKIELLRSKKKLSLGDKASQKFQKLLATKVELQGRAKFLQLQQERQSMIRAKVLAENDDGDHGRDNEDEEQLQADDDELDSGWQQASQGASQFNQDQPAVGEEKKEKEELESVSYEGDPEDAQEAVKEWSEHEWSSQEQLDV